MNAQRLNTFVTWKAGLTPEEQVFVDSLSQDEIEVLASITDDQARRQALQNAMQDTEVGEDAFAQWFLALEEKGAWLELSREEQEELKEVKDDERRTKIFKFLIQLNKEKDEKAKKDAEDAAQAAKERWRKTREKIDEKRETAKNWAASAASKVSAKRHAQVQYQSLGHRPPSFGSLIRKAFGVAILLAAIVIIASVLFSLVTR